VSVDTGTQIVVTTIAGVTAVVVIGAVVTPRRSLGRTNLAQVRVLVTTAALVFALSACWRDPEPPAQPPPTLSVPTLSPQVTFPPRSSTTIPPSSQTTFDPTAAYPLNQAQALGLLSAGYPVAGLTASGLEGLATRTTETAYENKQVLKQKCEYEYDYYEEKNVYKCHDEYVTESVPVEKTVYEVSNGVPRQSFSMPIQAIAAITAYGAEHWRKVA